MHVRSVDDKAVAALVNAYPLAWVISGGEATPLPLLPEHDGTGRLVSFLGHLARSNPQMAAMAHDADALLLFSGPQGYISPRHVADPAWAPTWNYAVARFRCRAELVPGETDTALRRLTARMEQEQGGSWTVEQMGERYEQLREHVVAFRAHILAVHATFKLGQDEEATIFSGIVDHIDDRMLADWMRRARQPMNR